MTHRHMEVLREESKKKGRAIECNKIGIGGQKKRRDYRDHGQLGVDDLACLVYDQQVLGQ